MSGNPALWARVRDACEHLDALPELIASMAEEGYLRQTMGEPDVPITGPGPSSGPPPRGDVEARRHYLQVCQSIARADCMLAMAAGRSYRLVHGSRPVSGAAADRRRVLSPGELVAIVEHLRAGLHAAHVKRTSRQEAVRRLRESVRAVERGYKVASAYRMPTPRKMHRRRA